MSIFKLDDKDISSLSNKVLEETIKDKEKGIPYADYLDILLNKVSTSTDRSIVGTNRKSNYGSYPRTIRIAPTIKQLKEIFEDNLDRMFEETKDIKDNLLKQEKKLEIMKEIIKPIKEFTITEPFKNGMWYGDSTEGVNIRLGFKDGDKSLPIVCSLSDDNVSGILGGITGSGKSVAFNTIIMNMMYEYPPWEINLNMGDCKKVELSRYGTVIDAPHVRAIAATDSPAYFISLFKDLESDMRSLRDLFNSCGLQNIKQFRRQFNMVMPRTIFLIDEFTQIFERASGREADELAMYIQSIAKLGRSMGFHQLFASQTMAGTISNDTLSQFSLGICLNADEAVSNTCIGNTGAVGLAARGKGWAVINRNRVSGKAEDNDYMRVPFLDAEEKVSDGLSYFYNLLKELREESDAKGFKLRVNYFDESALRSIEEFNSDFKHSTSSIEETIKSDHERDIYSTMYLLLGDSSVFKGNQNDSLEKFRIQSGRNRNMVLHSKLVEELRYMLLLTSKNLSKYVFKNTAYIGDMELFNLYRIDKVIKNIQIDITEDFDINTYMSKIQNRNLMRSYSNISRYSANHTAGLFMDFCLKRIVDDTTKYNKEINKFKSFNTSKEVNDEMIKFFDMLENTEDKKDQEYIDGVYFYNKLVTAYQILSTYEELKGDKEFMKISDLPVEVVWLYAPENLTNIYRRGNLTETMEYVLEQGPANNIMFIIVTDKYKMNSSIIKPYCKYIMASKAEDAIYNIEDYEEKNILEGIDLRITDMTNPKDYDYIFKKYQVSRKMYQI